MLEIDGIELEKMSELRTYIYGKNVGEKVNIKLVRSNKEYQISVTLAKKCRNRTGFWEKLKWPKSQKHQPRSK